MTGWIEAIPVASEHLMSQAAKIRSKNRYRAAVRQKTPGSGNKRSRIMGMLDDVTRDDGVEMPLIKGRVLNGPDVYLAPHHLSCYRSGNRIGFDTANPATQQLHDAQESAATPDFEKPATCFEGWHEVFLTVAGARPDHRNARQDRTGNR